jgi:Amt family ammonium transporter
MVCYLAVTKLKVMFRYDDSLDVFGVHCVGSVTGMLMLGFLANPEVNPAIANTFQQAGATVSLAGGLRQFEYQAIGVAFTAVLAGVGTFILLKLVNAVLGLRVELEDESVGLDLSQHGERAYNE